MATKFLLLNGTARHDMANASVYGVADTLAAAKELWTMYEDERNVIAEAAEVDGEYVDLRILTDEELAKP